MTKKINKKAPVTNKIISNVTDNKDHNRAKALRVLARAKAKQKIEFMFGKKVYNKKGYSIVMTPGQKKKFLKYINKHKLDFSLGSDSYRKVS